MPGQEAGGSPGAAPAQDPRRGSAPRSPGRSRTPTRRATPPASPRDGAPTPRSKKGGEEGADPPGGAQQEPGAAQEQGGGQEDETQEGFDRTVPASALAQQETSKAPPPPPSQGARTRSSSGRRVSTTPRSPSAAPRSPSGSNVSPRPGGRRSSQTPASPQRKGSGASSGAERTPAPPSRVRSGSSTSTGSAAKRPSRQAFNPGLAVQSHRVGDASAADIRRGSATGSGPPTPAGPRARVVVAARLASAEEPKPLCAAVAAALGVEPERVRCAKVEAVPAIDQAVLDAVRQWAGELLDPDRSGQAQGSSPSGRHRQCIAEAASAATFCDPSAQGGAPTFQAARGRARAAFARAERRWRGKRRRCDACDELLDNAAVPPGRHAVHALLCLNAAVEAARQLRQQDGTGATDDGSALGAVIAAAVARPSPLLEALGATAGQSILQGMREAAAVDGQAGQADGAVQQEPAAERWAVFETALLAIAKPAAEGRLCDAAHLPELPEGGFAALSAPLLLAAAQPGGRECMLQGSVVPVPGADAVLAPSFSLVEGAHGGVALRGILGGDDGVLGGPDDLPEAVRRGALRDLATAEDRLDMVSCAAAADEGISEAIVVIDGLSMGDALRGLRRALARGQGSFSELALHVGRPRRSGGAQRAAAAASDAPTEGAPQEDPEEDDPGTCLQESLTPPPGFALGPALRWEAASDCIDVSVSGRVAQWRRPRGGASRDMPWASCPAGVPAAPDATQCAWWVGVRGPATGVSIGVALGSAGPTDLPSVWILSTAGDIGVVRHGDYRAAVPMIPDGAVVRVRVDLTDQGGVSFEVDGEAIEYALDKYHGQWPPPGQWDRAQLRPIVQLGSQGCVAQIYGEDEGRQMLELRKGGLFQDAVDRLVAAEAAGREQSPGWLRLHWELLGVLLDPVGGQFREVCSRCAIEAEEVAGRGVIANLYRQQWDAGNPKAVSKHLQITDDRNLAVRALESATGAQLCRAHRGFSTGKHYWEVVLKEFSYAGNGFQEIGVCTVDVPAVPARDSKWLIGGVHANGWAVAFSHGWHRSHDDLAADPMLSKCIANLAPKKGLRVGVLLDMDSGTVTFLQGGSMVCKFTGLQGKTVYPAVSMGCLDYRHNELVADFDAELPEGR
eukprot:TRINITY_DN47062_c0_g1_i1.p1 TRINITY_DN47062_c0_g1~~TRINITY_DN47062_c0_g1_i1.p1  ORF type:complete len:1133 (+),score=261.12 TRINITY_DN47062_c0_g1_i1:83-3481(+)